MIVIFYFIDALPLSMLLLSPHYLLLLLVVRSQVIQLKDGTYEVMESSQAGLKRLEREAGYVCVYSVLSSQHLFLAYVVY